MVEMREHHVLRLVAVLSLMLSGISRLDAQQQEDSADLVFLIDGSNNVGRTGFTTIRDFLVNYVERRLEVGRSRMQVGVVQFSDDAKIEFTLDEHTTKSGLIDALKNLQYSGGEESNLGAAIEYVVEQLFSPAGGSRREEKIPQSLVVITGGPSSDDLREAANSLRLNSIITFGIGVERADTSELQQVATDDSFVFTVPQVRILGQLENQIVPYISGVAQRTIILEPPTIITEVTEVNKRDIVFLVDGSSDLGGASFSAIRELIVKIINRLEIGPDLIRVGLAQYAGDIKPEFYLNTFNNKKDVITHLKKLKHLNGSPLNTGAALSAVQRNFFAASAGSRVDERLPQLIVLFTGGQSRDDIVQPSQDLKRAGILTFAVGSKNADLAELQEIAFDSSLAFQPAEFKQNPLQALLPKVLTPLKTLTGVVITEGPTEVINQRDIVFLLDGSVNVGSANFPVVRDFIIDVINNLGISSEGTRVGLAQFSDTPRTEFYLNTLTSKSDLVDRVEQLRIKGGNVLNIGSALQFVIRNHFTRGAGSRIEDKIPQLLLVLVAGKSSDSIQIAANDLTRSGVLTFCVGVGNADRQELETIAFNPSLVYTMDDFSSLSGFSQQILSPLTTYVRGEVTEVTVTSESEDLKKDIVFLIDGSDAARSGFPNLRSFIQRVVEYLDVGQDRVRIAVVQYSDSARSVFLLNTYPDRQDIIRAIQNMSPIGGSVLNTGAALDYASSNVFTAVAGSRAAEGVPQFLILLTSGKSRDDVRRAATSLKSRGVVPYAIGTGRADRAELQAISFKPDFVLYVPDVTELESAYQTFSQRVKAMTTKDISTATDNRRDILFLIDGSTNIAGRFPVVRDFVANIIDGLNVSPDETRVSVGLVGDNVKVEFKFDSFPTKAEVVSAVRKIRFRPSREFKLGVALDYAHDNLFTPESGSRIREGVQQYLVLLAAGKSGDSVDQAADALKRAGVVTFAVKTHRAEAEDLEKIVLAPQFIVTSESLGDLATIQSDFVNLIKTASVVVQTETYDVNNRKDIVFLVDGSDAGRSNFPSLRSFIQSMVQNLDVDKDRIRIGVVQYSDTTRPNFLLNTHPDRQGVLSAVQRLTPVGGSQLNTGAALDYVTTNVFTSSAGSRSAEGVPQFLILLTGGRSRDDVRRPATELKRSGAVPFAIGVRNADTTELQTISFTPDFAVSVSDVNQLLTLYQTIATRVTGLNSREIETVRQSIPSVTYPDDVNNRKDIVFLVDGSDAGRSNFPSLRSFIQSMVQNLDVDKDRIRIGVVQYSDTTRPNFLLNTHPDRQGVLSAVQRLTPVGGSQLNTGAALDYVTTNVFTSSAGSRSAEGVPQFLILLTGGRSRDDVRRPATELKRSGAVPFAIGVRNADTTELQTISFTPDFAVSVSDVNQLLTLYQTIATRVTGLNSREIETVRQSIPSVTYPALAGAKRDVVFLVDGSRAATPEFVHVKELIGRIVETMDVSPDSTRVSVVQYSEDPKVEFLLNAHSTKDEVKNAVRRISPKGGSSVNTGNALEYVSKNIFTRPSGSRIEEQVPQFLIVTSSGPSSDDVEEGARQVKESSVVPFLIGKNINTEQANKITFGGNFINSVSSFQELQTLESKLLSSVTSLDHEKITEIIAGQPGPPTGTDPDRRDVVFLVDGSTKTGQDGLANIRDFILRVVQNFQIGPTKVRVGLVQFSNEPATEFFLRTNMNKPALVQNIRRLRYKGGTPLNIGKALDFVAKNHFVKSAGSRIEERVPQHLVLLTGGKSEDDISGAVRILGDNGIRSLVVASGNADSTEVQSIVTDPRYVFPIKEFKDLPNIESILIKSFEGPVVTDVGPTVQQPSGTGKKEADIVFLVDGSMNMGRDNFKAVLQFVSDIVDSAVEEEDSIQIGLAQFNSDVTDEFFLKDFSKKDSVIEAVPKAEYKGGRLANLGTAIRHLQDKHFVKEAGSRISTGAPQIAFIITGAKSVSEGQAASLALTSEGVKVFAIGVGSISADEITKIASDAASAFRVPNVQELSELNEQILVTLDTALQQRSFCPKLVDAVKECNLEVIIGFDVDVSPGQNIFDVQRELEPKVKQILERVSNMEKISCSGDKKPVVKVAFLSQGRTGAVEAFDFSDYRPELFSKITAMGTRGPFVLNGRTLQTYLNKFKTSGEDNSVKVVIHMTDGIDAAMPELQQASSALQKAGVRALLFVGLESVPKFDQVMELEFGRGFTYKNPLRLNRRDLDYEIIEELDSIAEKGCCRVPCKCSGHRGDNGPVGVIGVKGQPGLKGHQGFPGEEGGPGERGLPGVNGTQGFQGCPGLRGSKGSRGYSGDKGEIGEIALDGIDGEEGKRGSPGTAGERGSFGPRGEKGLKGHIGDRGDQGLRGDPGEAGSDSTQRGPKGLKGEAGSVGEDGKDGPAGQPGGPGKPGPQGRRGPSGLKGNRGGAGVSGGVGEQGLRGPQGPPGQLGTPGTRGEQGIPGPRGAGGTPGPVGDRGKPGPPGRKGEPGDTGPGGSDGPVGPRGEIGDDGRDGAGKPGQKGRKGETGFPGKHGPKGDSGDKGTNGDPGPKGSRGRRGSLGPRGIPGSPGDPGYSGPSGLKGERGGSQDQCALVKKIKDNCPCCYGPKECPVFPTDLVFAIDTSSDVNRNQFNNMMETVRRMVNQLTITNSNCPRGARVALLTYNSDVTTEVRFSEGLKKSQLLEKIQNLQLISSSKQRSLDGVMSFVARNTFKRARGGFLARKVAVFFSNAVTRASPQLNEAVLKLYDAGVSSVFLTAREDRPLTNALRVNNTDVGQAVVLTAGAQLNETIRKILSCHVCLDVCEPPGECGIGRRGDLRARRSAATDVDIDLAFLIDSSESTNPAQFAEIKRFVSHVVGQLELSPDPKDSPHHARISVLQHTPYEHQTNTSFPPVRIDVGLTEYSEKEKLQEFIQSKMTQLYGTLSLNSAIKYVVEHVFESAPNPRTMKVIFLILTGEVKTHELKQLRQTVIDAKCKGFFFVILGIGKKVNFGHLSSMASEPQSVFSKKADKASELHEETLLRFGLQLPGFISSENAFHLSPEIQKHCNWFQNDQPASTTENESTNEGSDNDVLPDEVLSSKKPQVMTVRASPDTPADYTLAPEIPTLSGADLQVLDVTENSVSLNWASADPLKNQDYELSVTSLSDQTLVLKQNVTGTEKLVGGLESGQLYQVTVTGQHKSHGVFSDQAIFSTSKSQPEPDVVESSDKILSTDPLDTPAIDPCELDLDMGTQCKENEVKWFFDKTNKICTQIWYGGCGGNANRFDTEVECVSRCQKTTVEKTILPALERKALAVGPEVCTLQKEEGTCREFVLKWHYDPETKSCARFWYGGCGGNENRFSTQKECEKICIPAPLNPGVVSSIGT
ncbi:collagen alpha-3(VI) chain [Mixophyes fleayi]|uniref:collagen alpha-3(VI) chain n=1 Tax=Mixophyes fleayi TaxID=3061075 RepID=UPI003F4D8535